MILTIFRIPLTACRYMARRPGAELEGGVFKHPRPCAVYYPRDPRLVKTRATSVNVKSKHNKLVYHTVISLKNYRRWAISFDFKQSQQSSTAKEIFLAVAEVFLAN